MMPEVISSAKFTVQQRMRQAKWAWPGKIFRPEKSMDKANYGKYGHMTVHSMDCYTCKIYNQNSN